MLQDLNGGQKKLRSKKKKKKKDLLIAMTAPICNCKFAGNINLKEAIHTLEGRPTIQRNLNKLEEEPNDSIMKFKKEK